MDARVVDLWCFGTACELLFGKCVSSVSHGHRPFRRSEESQPPPAIRMLAPSSATTSADLRTGDLRSAVVAAVCANAVSRHAATKRLP
jgi:hypothetical protein